MNRLPAVVQDLESCSIALLDALRRRDPVYLEHLEQRQRLLALLSQLAAPAPEVRAALERSHTLGTLALTEALRIRQNAAADLASLEQERQIAGGLRKLYGPQAATVDLRA